MTQLWYLLYNFLVIPLLIIFSRIALLFNSKIRRGLRDRKRLFENLIINLTGLDRRKKMIWFHSASMGEFEQAKPIIKRLKSERNINIAVTFFSPSGYYNSLNYPYADIISYMPVDTPALAIRFLNLVRPDLAVFMRYDIWPNFIWQLKLNKIPCFIVDATMRRNSNRKLWIAKSFHKSLYKSVTKILAVSEEDVINFSDFNLKKDQIRAIGDTRFDRVYQKSVQALDQKLFKEGFFNYKKVFVLGSSWESDEEVLMTPLLKLLKYDKSVLLILVPHEPTVMRLEKIEHSLANKESSIRFSFLNSYNGERIIIIDSIGILLTLYFYADAAYVGGSFKQGIHNVLEPAVYGIPVLYGPKIQNSQEALYLTEIGGGIVVKDKKEAYRQLRRIFSDEPVRKQIGKICYDYVHKNIGATDKILEEIYRYI